MHVPGATCPAGGSECAGATEDDLPRLGRERKDLLSRCDEAHLSPRSCQASATYFPNGQANPFSATVKRQEVFAFRGDPGPPKRR